MRISIQVMIDCHCHVLPGIDDGAANVEESLKLLKNMKNQGINACVATPHFHLSRQTPKEFYNTRNHAVNKLLPYIGDNTIPEILLGAEVRFYPSLIETNIDLLCAGSSDILLLELPFDRLTEITANSVMDFINSSSKRIMLAHIERYFSFNNYETLYNIMQTNCMCQINCSSIVSKKTRKLCLNLIESGFAAVIATDAHNMESRPPEFDKASSIIKSKLGKTHLEKLIFNSEKLFRG